MASWSEAQAVSGPQVDVTPVPKPSPRVKASRAEWETIGKGFEFATCCHCAMGPIELHHAVSRARGGSDVEANLIPVCRTHHQIFEDHAPGWEAVAASMRSYICSRSDRWAYVVGGLTEPLFDRTYPTLNQRCDKPVRRGNITSGCDLGTGHEGPCAVLGDEVFQRRDDVFYEPLEMEDRF